MKDLYYKSDTELLETKIKNTFNDSDFVLTFMFDDVYLPKSLLEAEKYFHMFLDSIKEYRKLTNKQIRYIYILDESCGRIHLHALINSNDDLDLIKSSWLWGEVYVKYVGVRTYKYWTIYFSKEIPQDKEV